MDLKAKSKAIPSCVCSRIGRGEKWRRILGVHGDKNGADLWSVSSDVAKIVKMPCQHGLLLFATCMVVLAKLFLSLAKLLLFPSFLEDFFPENKSNRTCFDWI
jgi:hypothetical protein